MIEARLNGEEVVPSKYVVAEQAEVGSFPDRQSNAMSQRMDETNPCCFLVSLQRGPDRFEAVPLEDVAG